MKYVKIGRREYPEKTIRNYRSFFIGLTVILAAVGIKLLISSSFWCILCFGFAVISAVAILTCTVGIQEAYEKDDPSRKKKRKHR